ncbi:MAG TPA: hypothetical protein VGJ79_00640 [Candidatus Dormibacteraeota bacterium]|jgi:hypothetical protein
MATTSDGDEGQAFVDQAARIDELAEWARRIDTLQPAQKFTVEAIRLALLSLNRMANSLAGLELIYAAIADHLIPEPEPVELEHEP